MRICERIKLVHEMVIFIDVIRLRYCEVVVAVVVVGAVVIDTEESE